MKRLDAKQPLRCMGLILLIVWWTSGISHAMEIDIRGNKLSVIANQIPLRDLLKKIAADQGAILRMDPDINPSVTISFKDRKFEEGLRSILKSHNHVLYWKPNSESPARPSAPPYLLTQIQVFEPGKKERMVDIAVRPPAEASVQTLSAPPGLSPTKVSIKGNRVYVPVILGYQDQEIKTTLLFDTGASSILVHRNIAEQFEIDEYQTAQGRGVGGIDITTKKIKLDYVVVGPYKKKNLRADIIDYQAPADNEYNGLLGMNFLRGLKYTIDFASQTIHWLP